MKIFLIFCVIFGLIYALPSQQMHSQKFENKHETKEHVERFYFYTKLDHYRPQDTTMLQFTYYTNYIHHQSFGPIFIYINDLGQFTTKWIEEGLMSDIATELHGALVTFNHRFYGDNLLTETASYDDLEYLTVGQSVADIAYLVRAVKDLLASPESKVILFGSGYGAKLASYARLRFPHLVDGVWASSGVYQPEATPITFYNLLSWNLHNNGINDCDNAVKNTFDIMEYLIEEEPEFFLKDFNLCHPIDNENPKDIAMFFENQIKFISDYVDTYHIQGLHSFCRDMHGVSGDPLNSFSRWIKYVYGSNAECFDFKYENHVQRLRNESWHQSGTISGERQTLYLQCTEIGYLKMTSSGSLFPNVINEEYLYGLCSDVFGERYRVPKLVESTRALTIQFGGRDQKITKIIYTNGMLDSWIDHAIIDDNFKGAKIVNLLYTSKSADLDSFAGWDSVEVDAAKKEIKRHVEEWSDPFPRKN